MKFRTYVLSVFTVLFLLSAGSDKDGLTVGYNPGDIAPKIESLGSDVDISFSNNSGKYTLLHFWTAYDAKSRMLNVLLWNNLLKNDLSKVEMISVSLDELDSVFEETVKTDNLMTTNQKHEALGEASEVYKAYGLKKGLRNFLIDDKGIIVAQNVTPELLAEII
jgi:hypothetical protein